MLEHLLWGLPVMAFLFLAGLGAGALTVSASVLLRVGGARVFGDISDPDSEISQLMATNPVTVLRPEKGTEPNVYYIAADHSDAHESKRGRYVRVTTHRQQKERR